MGTQCIHQVILESWRGWLAHAKVWATLLKGSMVWAPQELRLHQQAEQQRVLWHVLY